MIAFDPIDRGSIIFDVEEVPAILELKWNGDILVKGKLVTNDMDVVDALREFLLYWNAKR